MNASLTTNPPPKTKWNLPEPPKRRLRDVFSEWMRFKNYKPKTIEGYMAWMIKADSRFRIGQRVEWSRSGRRRGYPTRKFAKKGIVKAIYAFSITVKLDGLKQERSFHHAFFNPVSGPKLF